MSGERVAADACEPLITLARVWQEGWRPPAEVSEQLYQEVKSRKDPADPLTAFVGFGCTFGAKWFGGFARQVGDPVSQGSAISLERKLSRCADVRFTCMDFGALEILPGDLVYADPEYRGTTRYGYFRAFDHDRFVATAQGWAEIPGVKVFVSEYAAQADTWEQVAEFTGYKPLDKGQRTERLFRVRPC
jgi:DNA adenine methylase